LNVSLRLVVTRAKASRPRPRPNVFKAKSKVTILHPGAVHKVKDHPQKPHPLWHPGSSALNLCWLHSVYQTSTWHLCQPVEAGDCRLTYWDRGSPTASEQSETGMLRLRLLCQLAQLFKSRLHGQPDTLHNDCKTHRCNAPVWGFTDQYTSLFTRR